MLDMFPDCERCGADLPAEAPGGFICSFECTFCADCAEAVDDRAAGRPPLGGVRAPAVAVGGIGMAEPQVGERVAERPDPPGGVRVGPAL